MNNFKILNEKGSESIGYLIIATLMLILVALPHLYTQSLPEAAVGEFPFETKIKEERKIGKIGGFEGVPDLKAETQEEFIEFVPEGSRVFLVIEEKKFSRPEDVIFSITEKYRYSTAEGEKLEYEKIYDCRPTDVSAYSYTSYISSYDDNKFYCEKL